jgi:hypothetical protein
MSIFIDGHLIEGDVAWWNHDRWNDGSIKRYCALPFEVGFRKPKPGTSGGDFLIGIHDDAPLVIVVWGRAIENNGFEGAHWGVASMVVPKDSTSEERESMRTAFLDIVRLRREALLRERE